MYSFERKQRIPKPIEEVWDYFSDPKHLTEITPAALNFQILSQNVNRMYEGQIFDFQIEIVPNFQRLFRTQITECVEPLDFVEEQIQGPYHYWHHRHTFLETKEGVWMTDRVSFNLRYWLLGKLAYKLFVRQKLIDFFDFRSGILEKKFGAPPAVRSGCL